MEYVWNEAKRRSNIRKHGIDFLGVERLFAGATVTIADDRFDYGEVRFVTLGLMEGRAVAVVHNESPNVIRAIAIRKATKNEEKSYFEQIAD